MGNNKYNAISVNHNGIQYDSQTELNFHLTYPKLIRNELSFAVWVPECGGEPITYTPDFYDKDTNTYIEIKGSTFQFNETAFQLRWKLAKDYFAKNKMGLVALIPLNGVWLQPKDVKVAKNTLKKQNTRELNDILALMNRKTLKEWEKHYLIYLICNPVADWVKARKGAIVKKKKPIMLLRTKLLRAKDKYKLLQSNI